MAGLMLELTRTASLTLSVGTMVADATRPRRIKFSYLLFGSEGAPADCAIGLRVRRCTAAGTSTAVTPINMDPADATTEADAGENHTVDATYTANSEVIVTGVNQRATYQWFAPPDGMIVTPATASNGLGVETPALSTGTPIVRATVHCFEQ